MNSVFVVFHERPEDDNHHGGFKLIGIYDSQLAADEAVERARLRTGFADFQEDFSIDRYEINQDNWVEGFLSAR